MERKTRRKTLKLAIELLLGLCYRAILIIWATRKTYNQQRDKKQPIFQYARMPAE
jgi:hypothetical protein